jgi:hypothetical protein
MIRRSLAGLALVASVVSVPSASAQVPAAPAAPAVADSGIKTTNIIMRVNLYRFAEGMQQAALADLRTHLIPVWEAEKAAGIIVGYSTMANFNPSSRDDWQLGVTLSYKNYAALDSLGARIAPITLKHYGSAAARTAAADARAKLRVLMSSQLINVATYSRQ